ncbi:dihydrofolate reductase family protein [Actinomadura oligospora]|uniref:dihydrofolate reductase family protein n=1 Tax=Actinomadura oligospora TaxID=111804 RepID=UPI0004796EE1|nr:dihydrofolate reductase family protein [Actinomadura oligospora]
MRKLVYYVGASIDGYIAGPDGEVGFFPGLDEITAWIKDRYPDTLPTHVRGFLGLADTPNRHFDTLVMGRGTYEPALTVPTTSPYAHLRQYVASSTLEIDDPSVHVEQGDPLDLVRRLKAEDTGKDIWLCGGGRLAASLLPEIDEIVLKSYPVVAGAGIPVFSGAFSPTLFTPAHRENLASGTQVTWFTRNA